MSKAIFQKTLIIGVGLIGSSLARGLKNKNISDLISEKGNTNVKIVIQDNSKNLIFELSEKRKINPKILKSLKNEPYLKKINL